MFTTIFKKIAEKKKEKLALAYPIIPKLEKLDQVIRLFENHKPNIANQVIQDLFLPENSKRDTFDSLVRLHHRTEMYYEIYQRNLREKHTFLTENSNCPEVIKLVDDYEYSFDNTLTLFHGAGDGDQALENEILMTAKKIYDCLIEEVNTIISKRENELNNVNNQLLETILPQLESNRAYHENRIASKSKA